MTRPGQLRRQILEEDKQEGLGFLSLFSCNPRNKVIRNWESLQNTQDLQFHLHKESCLYESGQHNSAPDVVKAPNLREYR